MLPFSFMEIFFFLSLGITFVLILLIVYHFKQRITTMEHKSDTMFDIVQNLAKEISAMKSQPQPSVQMPQSHPSAEFGGGMFMPPIFMHQASGPMGFHMKESNNEGGDLEPVVEELDDEDDETDGESDDSDDESDDDDSDNSIIFTGEDVDIELCDIDKEVSAIEDENLHSNSLEPIGSFESFQKIKVEDDIASPSEEVLEPYISEPRVERQETLVEEELPRPEPESVLEVSSVIQENQDESLTTTTQDDYKKLSMAELKKLVATKGIATKDINKLKRPDLLKLLEKSA